MKRKANRHHRPGLFLPRAKAQSPAPARPPAAPQEETRRSHPLPPEIMAALFMDGHPAETAGDQARAGARRALAAQVTTLERMFHHLYHLACQEGTAPEACERLARLALRAQAQSRRTAVVLGRLCLAAPEAAEEPAVSQTVTLTAAPGSPPAGWIHTAEPPLPQASPEQEPEPAEDLETRQA